MNPRTVIRELAAAGALLASYPLDLIARQAEPLLGAERSEPVILAHGLGGSRANLLALATYLRMAGFHNIAYFEYPRWQPIADSAAELGALVRALAGEHGGVHLVGHSLGGTIARRYAADAPRGAVRSLLTLGSPYSYTQWSPNEIAVFGDEDPIVPPPLRHLTDATAFGKMVVLQSTGHLALLYHPEVLRIAGTELQARRAQ
jgi:triacylglycerol esterase/lipase EstA (alpha/beta hydrolase family)